MKCWLVYHPEKDGRNIIHCKKLRVILKKRERLFKRSRFYIYFASVGRPTNRFNLSFVNALSCCSGDQQGRRSRRRKHLSIPKNNAASEKGNPNPVMKTVKKYSMNTFQFIEIALYIGCLFLYLYFFTNHFQKGWINQTLNGKLSKKGFVDFRIFTVVSMAGMIVILKRIQEYSSN
jgi:hypothetical protein